MVIRCGHLGAPGRSALAIELGTYPLVVLKEAFKIMAEEGAEMAAEMPAHGMFCWSEFAVTDLERCRAFYENVFGWQFKRSESTGDEMEYLEFSSFGGDQVDGALYQMDPAMFGGHVPPAHVAQYVAVDNVDESLEQAKGLGGSVVFGPYDIPNVGRMAVINDPTGAAVSLITLRHK